VPRQWSSETAQTIRGKTRKDWPDDLTKAEGANHKCKRAAWSSRHPLWHKRETNSLIAFGAAHRVLRKRTWTSRHFGPGPRI
jgi:hypothetical protein